MYLRTEFQVSRIILTSLKQESGGNSTTPAAPPQNKPLKVLPRLGSSNNLFFELISALIYENQHDGNWPAY